ncbi:hypothetical protein AA313_de0200178 [Arthrobotrys entomopaga]|nr:hypothetical protein AA313_de0200178 [Arthrobotrys entomopaga]
MPPSRKRRHRIEASTEEGRQAGASSPSPKRQNRGLSASETPSSAVTHPKEGSATLTSSQLQDSGHSEAAQPERHSSSAAQVTQDTSFGMEREIEPESESLPRDVVSGGHAGRRVTPSTSAQASGQNLRPQLSITNTTPAANQSESVFLPNPVSRPDVHMGGMPGLDIHSDSSSTGAAAAAVGGLSLDDGGLWGGLSEAEMRRQISLLNALEQKRNRSETPSSPHTPTSSRPRRITQDMASPQEATLDPTQIRELELMREAARFQLQRRNISMGKESAKAPYEAVSTPSLFDSFRHRFPSHPALIDRNSAEYDSTWRYSSSKNCIEATVPMAYWMNNPNTQPLSTRDPYFKNFPSDPLEAILTRSGRAQMVQARSEIPEFKTKDDRKTLLVNRKKIHRKQDWTKRKNVTLERGWYRKYRNRTRDEEHYEDRPATIDPNVDSFSRVFRRNLPLVSNVAGSNPTDILNHYYTGIGMEGGNPGDTMAGPSNQTQGEEQKKGKDDEVQKL